MITRVNVLPAALATRVSASWIRPHGVWTGVWKAPEDPLRELCESWRQLSGAGGWRVPQDWGVQAVVAVASAVVRGAEASTPARALGAARARAGVGIVEAIVDLAYLYEAYGTPVAVWALASLADGWVAVTDSAEARATAIEAGSGLSTVEHLALRLADVFTGQAWERQEGGVTVVLVIDIRPGDASRPATWERDILLGAAVRRAFGGDVPSAILRGRAVVLVRCAADPVTASDVPGVERCREVLTSWWGQGEFPSRLPGRFTWFPVPAGSRQDVLTSLQLIVGP